MNKIIRHTASAAAFAILAITTSCGNKNASSKSANAAFTTTDITWTDSVAANNCSAKSEISVQYPSDGNAALLDSSRIWIAQTLMTIMPVDTAAADTLFSTEALADGQKLIANAGKRFLNDADDDFNSFSDEDNFSFNYDYQAKIAKVFSSDSVVTFTSSIYIYTGGAHGSTIVSASSFRTSDGRSLGYSIFERSNLGELTQMVKEALAKQYFETGDDFKMEDALIIDPQEFPLPATPPYFTEKGLIFVYQQYEIACYAAGLPTCTLPYSDIAPLLTPAARRLIP